MIKRIAIIAFYVCIPLGVFVLLGFAVESNKSIPCRSFRVEVKDEGRFVDSAQVVRLVYSRMDTLQGRPIGDLSLKKIEEFISAMYYVESAHVYRTIDGDVVANVRQRKPLARVINSHNESFYIDRQGRLMKTSDSYTARVMIVTGHIPARYSPHVVLEANSPAKEEMTASENLLRELVKVIDYIHKDVFWNAWIDQVYVTRAGEFELIPKNGIHVIELGRADDLDEKFNKLMSFYRGGLMHTGWNSYNRINLRFKNQIVCSK